MRNMVKIKEVGGNTYRIFSDATALGRQYGFSVNDTEVNEVTADTKLALSIFDKITEGAISEVHLRDICEDVITEASMA